MSKNFILRIALAVLGFSMKPFSLLFAQEAVNDSVSSRYFERLDIPEAIDTCAAKPQVLSTADIFMIIAAFLLIVIFITGIIEFCRWKAGCFDSYIKNVAFNKNEIVYIQCVDGKDKPEINVILKNGEKHSFVYENIKNRNADFRRFTHINNMC